MNDAILEAVAEQCHKQWSGWTDHLLGKMNWAHGALYLAEVWSVRWRCQINTPYAELNEEEKEADRREARKILAAIELILSQAQDPKLAEAWKTVGDMAQFTAKHPTCQTSTTRAIEALAAALRIETVKRKVAEEKVMIARQAAEGLQPAMDIYYIGLFQEQMKLRKAAEAELEDVKKERDRLKLPSHWGQSKRDLMADIGRLRAELVRKTELLDAIQRGATIDLLMPTAATWYDELKEMHRWNFDLRGFYACRNDHERSAACTFVKLTERQRQIYVEHLSDKRNRK